MFRPQSFQCLEAATDASGKVTGWKHCVVGDGEFLLHHRHQDPLLRRAQPAHRAARRVARRPAQALARGRPRVQHLRDREHGRPDGGRRSMDPIEFRFENMGIIPKAKKCFETVAQMCDWKAQRPDGRALGISITERSGSLGAGVVEISLDRQTGKIRSTRCGSRSTAASSCSRDRPRPTSRAPSSTASRACCMSA